MIKIATKNLPQNLLIGLKELSLDYSFEIADKGILLLAKRGETEKLTATKSGNEITIEYDKPHHFYRAFSLALQKIKDGEDEFSISETCHFDTNGPMFDVSQGNAVMTVSTVKALIRQLAMMGLNVLMLYCEDSFEVQGEEYFGYMRSKYSKDEIKQIDEYAIIFGIELVPCIQTLAHLKYPLKWSVYNDIAEDNECLLVGEEKTYKFIEKIIREATEPFSTNKVHIGMDEAWKLGRGKYLTLNGYTPPDKIMKEHLYRVLQIVEKLGLEPMMWSDMFFRCANGGKYYTKNDLPDEIINSVPENLRQIYWDYYLNDEDVYEKMMIEHLRFKSKPIFAGGVWTWNGFGPHWEITYKVTNRALNLCKRLGIKDILITVWGDGGTECPQEAAMFGICYFAESGYSSEVDFHAYKKRVEFCLGVNFDDFYALEKLNRLPTIPKDYPYASNPAKFLLWQDVLCGLFDKNIEGFDLNNHYKSLADEMQIAKERNGYYSDIFELNFALSRALSIKSELGLRITSAYKNSDKHKLSALISDIDETLLRIKELRRVHRVLWFNRYKAFGWDIFDIRYGAILSRIETAKYRLKEYLCGNIDKIEELEEPRLFFNGESEFIPNSLSFNKIISASNI